MENQQALFDFPKLEVKGKIRLIELFGGIGSQAMALRDIGADFERYRLVEFDKHAVKSYNAIHGTSFETTDIRDVKAADLGVVDKDKYTYIMTYSFPCTDLSVAGKMQGMSKKDWEDGKSTRSGLLWEVERILKEMTASELPQVLLMENVPQVHAEANREDFESWLSFLRGKGYMNFWQDLNAKDYGIPQNRDRCFCVSFLSGSYAEFDFPAPKKLDKVMKDFLEPSVDEKYYINNEKAAKLITELESRGELTPPHTERRLICASRTQEELKSPTASRRDTTPESQTCRRTEAVLLSGQGGKLEKKTDVATCLMARDYKGFGNQTANGVIEWNK